MKLAEHLDSWIPETEARRFGEVLLSRCSQSGAYEARHVRNRDTAMEKLRVLQTVPEVREMAKFCKEGKYPPLKTAPGLQDGWVIVEGCQENFYAMIDTIYPAAFATTVRYLAGEIEVVPFRTTLERQSGMNRDAMKVTDNEANQIMRTICAKGCLRVIAWPIDERCPVSRLTQQFGRRLPLICTEACSLAVAEAQKLSRKTQDGSSEP